jgi:ATP-dependent protease ClpP protease subunit
MIASKHFIGEIDRLAGEGIDACIRARRRGGFTRQDLAKLDALECSRFGAALMAYQLASTHEGRRVPDRGHLIPDPRARKGLHVANRSERPAIYVYGEIGDGFGNISAEDFQSALSTIDSRATLDLHVHSPGGSFHSGVAIHSLIKNRPGSTHGYVDGHAASAGSLILLPCDHVVMDVGTTQMIHFASLDVSGSWGEKDFARALDVVQETNRALLDLYSERWQGTREELHNALSTERYFSPEQAIAVGLCDAVGEARIAAHETTRKYHNASFSVAAKEGPHKQMRLREAGFRLWQMLADEMREHG